MPKQKTASQRGSLLNRRLKTLMNVKRSIHNPITWVSLKDRSYSILLNSNDEKINHITLTILFYRLKLEFLFPKLINPAVTSVYNSIKGFKNKGWVYRYAPKIYGIGYLPNEKVINIFYGVNSGNASGFPKDKLKSFIPKWYHYRLIKHVIVDKNNKVFWENSNLENRLRQLPSAFEVLGSICPKLRFTCVTDKDELVSGSAFIEEKTWYKGFSLFGIRFNHTRIRNIRILRVHLQTTKDTGIKSEWFSFTLGNKTLIEEGVLQFCEFKNQEKDGTLKLHLKGIESI